LGTECECKNWNEKEFVGNLYATRFADAWDAVCISADKLNILEQKTVQFVADLCESDMPKEVLEAALFNLSTLRTQTCFISKEGNFFGWEGSCDHHGCCWGSCTHVWNYEQSTAFLFGSLAKDMRNSEFHYATDEKGLMSFRIGLPLEKSHIFGKAAADGQMGCIMKIYREWKLSGDNAMLEKLWRKVRKSMEFVWIEGGWDSDCDGVMEGCQHNTMDVEYFGPNPQMQFWYLGALKACENMAHHIGDYEFAEKCGALFTSGSKWTDDNLFNGDFYEHHIIPPKDEKEVSPYLTVGMGSKNFNNPDYQLGAGCLVDQLAGQFMAHICGLGYLAKPSNIRKTLKSIMKYNYRDNFLDCFNHMRSYALGKESALVMASYPNGNRPKVPFPYFNEVMTGFEYTAAIGMLFEKQDSNALKCIKNIRDRYDGSKRSPFNEAECGHHYARAMAAWGAIIAITGFDYSGVNNSLSFNCPQKKSKWFWSNGYSYGIVEIKPLSKKAVVLLRVVGGELRLRNFALKEFGCIGFDTVKKIKGGKELLIEIKR
jgi:non-lysosomal glucosylceramidase